MLSREQCLEFLEVVVENFQTDHRLRDWVESNLNSLETNFDRGHYLKLKHQGLIGARGVLEELGRIEPVDLNNVEIEQSEKHCRYCGADLFWALPGQTSASEISAFGELIGDEEIKSSGWIHPGVYCPNRCTFVMYNFERMDHRSF
ncbi:hypothetical protein [Calycomorphotria hydatis]|uniref:Uncharacterized protein n=1 Tax=Calycomorphotria hydatis TaxID=2528027 RepID=A0A517T3Z9_9PLAN|nr:hypothetical protein [Calycomorphotria hydatis]QDT63100.1 hypothetical protein V22_03000 [Calycomorphotria hydatis]